MSEKTIQQEISEGLSELYKSTPIDNTGAEFMNIVNPENIPAETKAPENKQPEIIQESSLTDEIKDKTPTEPANTSAPVSPEPVPEVITKTPIAKSFEEQLAEKTAGKFKSWDEVENLVNAPKTEFASPEVQRINELVAKGVTLNQEFFELQGADFEKMEDPLEVMKEAFKRKPEYQGLPQNVLDFELNKKYNLREWIDKDDSELTEEDNYNRAILLRDAHNDREWLISYKNDRILSKEPDPEQMRIATEQKALEQSNWERFVDEELANKTSKLSTKIDDKESVDFEVSNEDRKYASDMMKAMTKDVSVFWNQFTDKDGKINQKEVFEAILYWKNRNNIAKTTYNNALAKGAEAEVKNIKNISFEPNETAAPLKADWRIKAQQDIEKHL